MSTFKLLGATAILFAVTVPAMAQQAMSEPAYCAFFYPNANCQNKGPGNPYTDPNYRRSRAENTTTLSRGQMLGVAGKRSRTQRSDY